VFALSTRQQATNGGNSAVKRWRRSRISVGLRWLEKEGALGSLSEPIETVRKSLCQSGARRPQFAMKLGVEARGLPATNEVRSRAAIEEAEAGTSVFAGPGGGELDQYDSFERRGEELCPAQVQKHLGERVAARFWGGEGGGGGCPAVHRSVMPDLIP